MYGVVATKLSDRSWNRWGWMTKYFDYTEDDVAPVVTKLGGRILSRGCDGDDVKQLQIILISWGYDLGKWGADGEFGSKTECAVREFQEEQGVPVTGVYDERTHASLSALLDAENDDQKPDTDPVEPPANVYPVRWIFPDLSEYQGELNYDAFCDGCDSAIIRSRVNGKNDGIFVKHATEFNKRNFPFSVYDYVTLSSEADAINQADKQYERCNPFNPIIYFVDTEALAKGVSHADNRKYVAVYVNRLRQRGVSRIGLYTFESMYQNNLKQIEGIFDVLWIANFGKNTGFVGSVVSASEKLALHQYTSMGGATNKEGIRVPGAPGCKKRIDLNRLTGSKSLSYFTGRKHSGTEYFGLVRVVGDTVNIRSGPGAQYKKVGLVKKGELLALREGSGKGWNAVKYKGISAYISMEFTRAVDE
jgi:peptidoglycan hydrolase-like protein with peptidoglycan-binding domain